MDNIFEGDNWTADGKNFLTKEIKEKLKQELEEGLIILQHWFYRGSRSPSRIFFEDYVELEKYLKNTNPGDIIEAWSFSKVCNQTNMLAEGKIPDEKGRVPTKGPY